MNQPFLFSYGTWEKRATIQDGVANLTAEGITPKGGAGVNETLDLSGKSNFSPGLNAVIGQRNTLKNLKLMLVDTKGRTGTYRFKVPLPHKESIVLTPDDGAPFSEPNETGKNGSLDLNTVFQWQLMGDWVGDGAVDVKVQSILSLPVTSALLQARANKKKRNEEARRASEIERIADREKYGKRTADSPRIERVFAAAPNVIALEIHSGKIVPARLSAYVAEPGDVKNDNGGKDLPRLIRNGRDLGILIGPPKKETGLVTIEGFSGDPLLLAEADDAENYSILSNDDPKFTKAIHPRKVMRKSKPDDWQQPIQQGVTVQHVVYLELSELLKSGKTYSISVGKVNTEQEKAELRFDPSKTMTESIHVNQVGFRPEDPLKRAFVSLWMGNGGGYEFPSKMGFHLIDAASGKSVYEGAVGSAWSADKPEKMATERNFNKASVSTIDFSDFKVPGKYRVMLDGVGVSFPFDIGAKTWESAFKIQMKGFYNQRSGVELGPPYTDFIRPVSLKLGVNECMPITQSKFNILDNQPGGLSKNNTGIPVPEAWGGYHDAGDWNPRRIDHISTTTFWQLELLQLFPGYFGALKLNIPNDAPGPDLLKECLFELSLFHRLQLKDGSCRYGIETDGDPSGGEASWKQHMPIYVYGSDALSSYVFAAVAARASQVLETYDSKLAKTYRADAIRAMIWAEGDRAKRKANGTWDGLQKWNLVEQRNLAAVCLYALTREPRWNEISLEDTLLKNETPPVFRGNQRGRDACFVYTRLPEGIGNPDIKRRARLALIADADGALNYQNGNAFGIASDDPGKPQFLGFYSTPHGAVSLLRAYQLSRDEKYLKGAIRASLFPAGANPGNQVFTSGVGANPIRHALNLDAIATGQKPPLGITPYGIVDLNQWKDNWIVWPLTYFLGKRTQPEAFDWPVTESFFDVRFMPALNEFTMDQTMGPNAYVWGFLAARK